MQNHFELFQLPLRFTIDMTTLNAAFHEIVGRVHPDRFAQAPEADKRVAMQWATRANEAYQTLKNPLKRAAYLCQLHGVDLQVESNTAMPAGFLMQQMAWREALDDAREAKDLQALELLETTLRQARLSLVAEITTHLDAQDFRAASGAVRCLMFIEKFSDDVGFAFDALAG